MAILYIASGRPVIIAAMHHNLDGIYYEQADPVVAALGDEASLSQSLLRSLMKFSLGDVNLRDSKIRDWPSYRLSECKSVRQFEQLYLPIKVRAVNRAELFYYATCRPRGETSIDLQVTLNRYAKDGEIGSLVMRLFRAALGWKLEVEE